jgi:hypothetical protein
MDETARNQTIDKLYLPGINTKIDKAARILVSALTNFFQTNAPDKTYVVNYESSVVSIYYPNGDKVRFLLNPNYHQYQNVAGWYVPVEEHKLSNERVVNINFLYALKLSVEDISLVLLHEMIHAGVLNGTHQILDEALTDQTAEDILTKAGIDFTFVSGYTELKSILAHFGDRLSFWQERILNFDDKDLDLGQELAMGISSLVFGGEKVKPPNYDEIIRYIDSHRSLLEIVLNRLIKSYNKANNQITSEQVFDLDVSANLVIDGYLLNHIYQKLSQMYLENDDMRKAMIDDILNFHTEIEHQIEDKHIVIDNHFMMRYFSCRQTLYIWEFMNREQQNTLVNILENKIRMNRNIASIVILNPNLSQLKQAD